MKPWPLIEREWIPDSVLRWGIRRLLAKRLMQEERRAGQVDSLIERLRQGPIAVQPDAANRQHYELPTEFFRKVLGPRLKYSCCWWDDKTPDLATAESAMLGLTCDRAALTDGQTVLELGCGWGSLCLYMAERYPRSRIVAVSNSRTQKAYIDERVAQLGLTNLEVITADMNGFETDAGRYDRVVSVEMFEHMRNHEALLGRIRRWLKPDGRLFVHIFCHDRYTYLFESKGEDDWMAQYFFTGGIMPSFDLLGRYNRHLTIEQSWRINGLHYARTLRSWLARMDANRAGLRPVFESTFGSGEAQKWWVYWRIFFMACEELFAFRGGNEWYVAHYRFAPTSR